MLIGSMTKLKMGPSDWLFDIKDWLGMWEVTRWLPDFPHAVGRLRQKERMSNLFLSWRQVIEREKKVGFFCCGISTWIFASHLSEYPSFKNWGIRGEVLLGLPFLQEWQLLSAPVLSCGLFWKLVSVPCQGTESGHCSHAEDKWRRWCGSLTLWASSWVGNRKTWTISYCLTSALWTSHFYEASFKDIFLHYLLAQ